MKAAVTDAPLPAPPRLLPDLLRERALWAAGYRAVAGIDEVGRGALAGPVVAAAVVLPADPAVLACLLGRVDDSKRLTPAVRARLNAEIRGCALAVGVGSVPSGDIDRLGIVPATRLAMARALAGLPSTPDHLLIDFLTLRDAPCPQLGLPHGDALCLSIAAASIVAKVARDAWMVAQDAAFPGYGFAEHKGYGTPGHQAALVRLGPCPLHRLSFEPLSPRRGIEETAQPLTLATAQPDTVHPQSTG